MKLKIESMEEYSEAMTYKNIKLELRNRKMQPRSQDPLLLGLRGKRERSVTVKCMSKQLER